MQTVKEQSNVRLKLIDPLGKGIEGLKYEVKKEGQVIAKGKTDANGKVKPFNSELGAMIDLYVARFDSGEMKKIKVLIPWAEVFSIKLLSSKIKELAEFVKHEGDAGKYKRKTYVVKSGDTLESVAQKNGTTVGTLATLNEISSAEEISSGQTLKLPPEDSEGDAPASAPPAAEVASPSAAPTPDPKVNESGSPEGNKQESINSSEESVAKRAAATNETTDVAESSSSVAKKEGDAPVPTEKTEDRGENGTPKTTVGMVCDKTACIKLGDKGDLVEEINIRLTGFGGTVSPPQALNEFTSQTEKAVRQFQRDYMGVAETGKVCGPELRAIDDFLSKYPVNISSMKCPCGKCDGFGNAKVGTYKSDKKKLSRFFENPGINRRLFWAFRAVLFYLIKYKELEYSFLKISSGYRCWYDNEQNKRTSINHMGDALDVHFVKGNSTVVCQGNDVDTIREKIFVDQLGASNEWPEPNNAIRLEPASAGATRWVHFDFTRFDKQYIEDRFYATRQVYADGDLLMEIARREERLKLINCGGIPPRREQEGDQRLPIASLSVSEKGLGFIKDWEKSKTMPYNDSLGFCTIGVGHLIAKETCEVLKQNNDPRLEKYNNGISQKEVDDLFRIDIKNTVDEVKKYITAPLYQSEFDALCSLVYNVGGNFRKFKNLISKINTKNYHFGCQEFADITNGGKEGLELRRRQEMWMFRCMIYNSTH